MPAMDWRCGGNVFAHVAYARQVALKGEIIQDAFGRIGRVPLPAPPDVIGSPEQGYRMRARLHARDGRIGFFREGTHELCDAAATGQLAAGDQRLDRRRRRRCLRGTSEGSPAIEIAENVAGDQRAVHLELARRADAARVRRARGGRAADRPVRAARRSPGVERLAGEPS